MRFNTREGWPRLAREGIDGLGTRNIPLPDGVTAALAVLDRIEISKPVTPEHTAVRQAIIDGANVDTLNALLLADLTFGKLNVEWTQAKVDAAGAVVAAILAAADEIMPTLTELAEAAILKLVAVAALEGAKLDDLVRAGRTDDAQAVANVATVAAELDGHYDFRDRFLTRGGMQALTVNGWYAGQWRDPVMARHYVSGSTPAERYLRGLTAGVPLWFPTRTEAIAMAQEVADGQAAEDARIKSQQHGVGSMAAFS